MSSEGCRERDIRMLLTSDERGELTKRQEAEAHTFILIKMISLLCPGLSIKQICQYLADGIVFGCVLSAWEPAVLLSLKEKIPSRFLYLSISPLEPENHLAIFSPMDETSQRKSYIYHLLFDIHTFRQQRKKLTTSITEKTQMQAVIQVTQVCMFSQEVTSSSLT